MKTSPPLQVLLVEGDEDVYAIMRDLLADARELDFVLSWAASYEAAAEGLACDRHDVYLVDYRLGDRTGLEFVREMAARGCAAPVILLSGEDDADVDLAAIRAGATDYLVRQQVTALLLERSIRYAIERKRTEEALRESEVRFRAAAEKFQTEFVARVSHELRTPLTAIKGFTDLILEGDAGPINADVREFLDIVKLSADQLMDLVNGILDLAPGNVGNVLSEDRPGLR